MSEGRGWGVFNGLDRVSIWEEEKVLETDHGDGYTTM